MQRLNRLVPFVMMLFTLVGCGESLYKVKGAVTFEGKPLPGGGSVSFVPLGNQRAAGGVIAEDGTYELTTNKPGDGAMAGDYRVVITQVTEREPKNLGDGVAPVRQTDLSLPMADRIHTKYADHYNSPLTAKVEAKSPNVINFQLKRE